MVTILFTDLSDRKYEEIFFTKNDPYYKNITEGINIFGICQCKKCKNFKKEIIIPLKKVYKIDLIKELELICCPECEFYSTPKKIGFYCCEYTIQGKCFKNDKINNFKFMGKSDNQNIIQFYGGETNKVPTSKLFIEIIKIYEKKKTDYLEKNNLFDIKESFKDDIFSKTFSSNFFKNKLYLNLNPINELNDINEKILDMKEYIGKLLTIEDIEDTSINDYKIQSLRENKIERICKKIINSKMTYLEYYNSILELGSEIKKDIIFKVFHYPNEFVKIKEIKKIPENSPTFVKLAIFTYLNDLGIITCIPKNPKKNPIITSAMLQLISCVDINREILTLKFKMDKRSEYIILNDEKEKEIFLSEKTHFLSKILGVKLDDIILSNIRKGCIKADLFFTCFAEVSTSDLKKILSENGIESEIKHSLMDGFYLIDDIFDSRGNRRAGWGINEKRGPPGYLKDYIPPLEYTGYGLNVKDRYDEGNNNWLDFKNKEGEWYIAYHGTGGNNAFRGILNPRGLGLKQGWRQVYRNSNNCNILNNKTFIKCKEGVYLTPKIEEAQNYSSGLNINGNNYYLIFMCRVNPYKVRIPVDKNDYWIVSGGYEKEGNYFKPIDEVRPYRVLLKNRNSQSNNICCFIY